MTYSSRRLIITIAIIAAALASVAALFVFAPSRRTATPDAKVAVTVFPLFDIVRNIAGDGIQVHLILPPNAEPHTFEPSPSTLRALQGAAAIYEIGHGLDGWTSTISGNAPRVTVDRDIVIMAAQEGSRGHGDEEGEADGGDGHESSDDPHYWLTIPNALKISETVASDLSSRFPDRRQDFERNLTAYREKLAAADREIRALLDGVKKREIITLHDAWYYFAAAYGLSVAGTFEPTAGREPTPQWLAVLKDAVKEHGVKTLYREPQFDSNQIQTFADDNGLSLVVLDDLGGTPGRETYIDLMIQNAHAVSQNQ